VECQPTKPVQIGQLGELGQSQSPLCRAIKTRIFVERFLRLPRTRPDRPMTGFGARAKFAVLLGVSLLAGWRPLADTFNLALNNEEYTHILLVLPLAGTLIALDRHLLELTSRTGSRMGVALLIASTTVAALARWAPGFHADVQLSLAMIALIMWWIGAFVFSFGTQVSRSLLFPLCFLLWMVPFPALVLDWIIQLLQRGSAFSARLLFESTRVPVAQDGLLLSIPGVTLEVAKECSSIRSSMMLLVTTMVVAQLFLRSPWRKALVMAVAIPLTVAKNGLRIFTIGMLGTRVDPAYLTGSFHHHGGIIFLAIALGAVFLLLWILRRGEEHSLVPSRFDSVTVVKPTQG
jgi:exosortase